ncbi:FAD-dependent oxidoreductase [Ancylobacter amanitiformis]|uniref:FAD-dependent oxidoreductase n=1 Tax=Ancylobacter amanitiformis TaxID=217069 RepID=UPI003521AB7D
MPQLLDELKADRGPKVFVIGAGAAGVELALSIHHRLKQLIESEACRDRIRLIDEEGVPTRFPDRVRQRLAILLDRHDIACVTRSDGEAIERRRALVWAAGVRPARWLVPSGLVLDIAGSVQVDAYLQSTSHAGIFFSCRYLLRRRRGRLPHGRPARARHYCPAARPGSGGEPAPVLFRSGAEALCPASPLARSHLDRRSLRGGIPWSIGLPIPTPNDWSQSAMLPRTGAVSVAAAPPPSCREGERMQLHPSQMT